MTKRKIPLRGLSADTNIGLSMAIGVGTLGAFIPAILSPIEDFTAAAQGSAIGAGLIFVGGFATLGAANLITKGLNFVKDREERINMEKLPHYRAQQNGVTTMSSHKPRRPRYHTLGL
tara:strand:- start:1350 stop:1703 length:354 start_codon:yes stop_codon:yes gene_type:complete